MRGRDDLDEKKFNVSRGFIRCTERERVENDLRWRQPVETQQQYHTPENRIHDFYWELHGREQ